MPKAPFKRKKIARKKVAGLPAATDWRTTDEQERLKRRLRAEEEAFHIKNENPEEPIFSRFRVRSSSGLRYSVEIRDVKDKAFDCTCKDFLINGLGTCKHVEATLLHLGKKQRRALAAAKAEGSPHADIVPDPSRNRLVVERNLTSLPQTLRSFFDEDGRQRPEFDGAEVVERLSSSRSRKIRLSQRVFTWLEKLRIESDRVASRRDYETGVIEGRHPEHVTLSPLFPYQREGMLHLAFKERALLADEMGLGKTIQAIAACALLHHLGKVRRVLVVTPASLKTEWEEQIGRFTTLPQRLVFGGRARRAEIYGEPNPPFFTICNYEQILRDSLDINKHFKPDIVVLDEAQRHVSGMQLCEGLRDFAIQQYGRLALPMLRRWNIHRTEDFGHIVFAMVEAGLMQAQESDTLHDFDEGFDFEEAFACPIPVDDIPLEEVRPDNVNHG